MAAKKMLRWEREQVRRLQKEGIETTLRKFSREGSSMSEGLTPKGAPVMLCKVSRSPVTLRMHKSDLFSILSSE
jgi:hypothetical protein